MPDLHAIEATVRGKVQGVGFRYATQKKARSLGLRGYVKNLPRGDVEVYAEGDRDALQRLASFLHRGPRWARVQDVEIRWGKREADRLEGFNIRY